MNNKITFANYILSRRRNIGMKQAELAEIVGVRVAQISRWENGFAEPGVTNFLKLCKALAINPNEMMWVVEGESNDE